MRWYEDAASFGPDLLLLAACALAALGTGLALLRWRAVRQRVARLERDVAIYSEASTRVAMTLEEMLLKRVQQGQVVHSSRRYLLNQARDRLSRGEPLAVVSRGLGLSFDEARLLERSTRRQHDPATGARLPAA